MLPAASPDVGVSPAFTESVRLMKKTTAQQEAVRTDAKVGLKHARLANKYVVISQMPGTNVARPSSQGFKIVSNTGERDFIVAKMKAPL